MVAVLDGAGGRPVGAGAAGNARISWPRISAGDVAVFADVVVVAEAVAVELVVVAGAAVVELGVWLELDPHAPAVSAHIRPIASRRPSACLPAGLIAAAPRPDQHHGALV